MKRLWLLGLLFACILISGCQQAEIDATSLAELNGVYLVRATGQPFSGQVTGHIMGKMTDGRWQGRVSTYFPDGKIQSEAHFRKGVMHGVTRSWYADGQVRSESTFLDGVLDGAMAQWWGNGQLQSEKRYSNGQEHGVERGYLRDGRLSFERSWIRGQRDGFELHYCKSNDQPRSPGSDLGMCSKTTGRPQLPVVLTDDAGVERRIWCFESGVVIALEQCRQWVSAANID